MARRIDEEDLPGTELVIRRCPNCDKEVAMREDDSECPRCGGLIWYG